MTFPSLKPFARIVLASLSGFLAGRLVLWLWSPQGRSVPALSEAKDKTAGPLDPALPPGAGRGEVWRLWLQARAPLSPLQTAEEFWSRMPAPGKVPDGEWRLALDEAWLTLPDAEFLKVIQDPRFGKFPPLYEAEQKAAWSQKLLRLGLEQALAVSGKLPTPWLNVHLETMLTKELAEKDPARGLEWLRSSGKDAWDTKDFIQTVAKLHPDKAIGLVKAMTPEATRKICASALLGGLAEKDWKAAVEFGKANFTGEEWVRESSHMFDGIYGPRLAGLLKLAPEITDPDARSAAYSQGLFVHSETGDILLSKVLELPSGTLNAEGWGDIAWLCTFRAKDGEPSPAAAAAKLREQAGRVPEGSRGAFWDGVISTSCSGCPAVAAQFYEELSDKNLGNLVSTWVEEDPKAASAWLTTLADSEKREMAVAKFCQDVTPVDPPGAAAWAAGLKDTAVREARLRGALSAWSQQDGAQARAWAEGKGLENLLPEGEVAVSGP